jgi:hypothetical protein
MGVDHTNVASGGRQSVRLTSKKAYTHGLIVLDASHMPGGCGTWPAFWTVGGDWPNGGEIDIIEGVNSQTTNDMTLHTNSGCSITNNGQFSGSVNTQNCDINAQGQAANAGCQIGTSNTASYGDGFNSAQGGIYATEWTSDHISIWFFPRSAIPADLGGSGSGGMGSGWGSGSNSTGWGARDVSSGASSSGGSGGSSPDPSGWGPPVASFSSASCDIDSHFQNNQIVFDTTFCGDWAGNVWSSDPVCSTKANTCNDFVANNPSAFTDAYWTVNSLRVYQSNGVSSGNGTSSPGAPPSSVPAGSSQTVHGWPFQPTGSGSAAGNQPAPTGWGGNGGNGNGNGWHTKTWGSQFGHNNVAIETGVPNAPAQGFNDATAPTATVGPPMAVAVAADGSIGEVDGSQPSPTPTILSAINKGLGEKYETVSSLGYDESQHKRDVVSEPELNIEPRSAPEVATLEVEMVKRHLSRHRHRHAGRRFALEIEKSE